MTKFKMLRYLCSYILLITFIILSDIVMAEEILIKRRVKYLGWQTSKDKFITCYKNIIEIEDGRIEKTNDKCPKRFGPGPLVVSGTIEGVDVYNKTFKVRTKEGREISNLFYPGATIDVMTKSGNLTGKQKFYDLKTGDRVRVTVPIPGRAEAISKFHLGLEMK